MRGFSDRLTSVKKGVYPRRLLNDGCGGFFVAGQHRYGEIDGNKKESSYVP